MSGASAEIVTRVRKALDDLQRPTTRPLVVGLSGGVDSQVLAHALMKATADSGPALKALHVNHRLRPSSDDDARRVARICEEWGLSCDVAAADVAAWDAALEQGTESAARHARYAELARCAIDANTDTIVTGHTLDDQAETVILKLISGSGLEGLSAMSVLSRRPIRLEPGRRALRRFALFRPLLSITRKQIEEYAREHGIEPVEDESNLSSEYRRNLVRQTVIPGLEAVEPSFREAISRTTGLLTDDVRFITDSVDEAFVDIVAERSGLWMLERQQFRTAYIAIQRRVLFRVIEPLLPISARLSQERIEALRVAAVDGEPGKVIELADDLIGYVDYDRLAIGQSVTLEEELRKLSWVPLLEPGTTINLSGEVDVPLLNGWRVRGHAATEGELVLRTRRDGDRTRNARGREIKLQDWLVDRKVPRYLRDWLPLVVLDGEIHWLIGLDVTEFPDARNNLHLHLELDASGAPESE